MNSIIQENDIYDSLKQGTIDKIIRHFKIIVRSNYDTSVDKIYNVTKGKYGYTYEYNDALSQNINNYNNSIILEPIELYNNYKDQNQLVNNKFKGKQYKTISAFKSDLELLKNEASVNYINDVINSMNNDELESISNLLDRFINNEDQSLYIRMAPDPSMKESLLKRICILNGNSLIINNEEFFPAENDGIPVLNDNIAYSNNKYDQLQDLIKDL